MDQLWALRLAMSGRCGQFLLRQAPHARRGRRRIVLSDRPAHLIWCNRIDTPPKAWETLPICRWNAKGFDGRTTLSAEPEHIALAEKVMSEPPKERFDRVISDSTAENRHDQGAERPIPDSPPARSD